VASPEKPNNGTHWGFIVTDECETGPVVPTDPRCAVVQAKVWPLLDGMFSALACEPILRHFDECPSCMCYFKHEARIKLLIATKCGGDKVPRQLGRRRLRE
jgi:mycothiol system anti-sigma-R factor